MKSILFSILVFISFFSYSQTKYLYSVDLTKAADDMLSVELMAPKIESKSISFFMPKLVPGTYRYSDYGKFVHNLKAFDGKGKELSVTHPNDNEWIIKKSHKLSKITYTIEDTWDSKIANEVYLMSGTTFEDGKNFSINTCGVFGYLDGMKKLPIEVHFTKPSGFYASSGVKVSRSDDAHDVFNYQNVDHFYDSPVMFCIPDTTIVKVGDAEVLISVYSPKHMMKSKSIADRLTPLLNAAKKYLGGKLPVDKYAFIYYFNGEQRIQMTYAGAWEHSYSSFYSMPELPESYLLNPVIDMSSHEFFHIITPLTICSKEIREFNFNQPELSKHLWLYEGSTEYDAHHVQVTNGLKTPDQFYKILEGNIKASRAQYNDTLPFTEMSKECAGKYKNQYNNVYVKGMLISACMDILLLDKSDGAYTMNHLKHDLGVKYGKVNYFNDDELFGVIENMTYPEIHQFLQTYVSGTKAIPYQDILRIVGVTYDPATGHVSADPNADPRQIRLRNAWLGVCNN